MPIDTAFDPVNRFVLQVYSGVQTKEDYIRGTEAFFALVAEHGVKDCLLDVRRLDNRASLVQVYDLPQLYIDMAFPRGIRISILAEPGQKDEPAIRFYETICLNRGWEAKISYDPEAAIRWFKETAP